MSDITFAKHHNHSRSNEANPKESKKLRDRLALYDYFKSCGERGAIREEAILALGLPEQSGYPRCSELVRDGWLFVTGRKGITSLGNKADVLVCNLYAASAEPPERFVTPEELFGE